MTATTSTYQEYVAAMRAQAQAEQERQSVARESALRNCTARFEVGSRDEFGKVFQWRVVELPNDYAGDCGSTILGAHCPACGQRIVDHLAMQTFTRA
jgi:hypothetical protein